MSSIAKTNLAEWFITTLGMGSSASLQKEENQMSDYKEVADFMRKPGRTPKFKYLLRGRPGMIEMVAT